MALQGHDSRVPRPIRSRWLCPPPPPSPTGKRKSINHVTVPGVHLAADRKRAGPKKCPDKLWAHPGTEGAFLGIALHPSAGLFLHVFFIFCKSNITVPEFIDPVYAKTSPKPWFSLIERARFGLVFTKLQVYKFGHSSIRDINFYVLHFYINVCIKGLRHEVV
jgi:hypothetical protein